MSGMIGGLSHPAGGDAALRRALLQRIADRLAYARAAEEQEIEWGLASCCWVTYEWPTPPDYGYRWHRFTHRICNHECPHWHHHTEVFLA